MARILFVQPSMQPPGGGNGVAAWMLQALADQHEVTVLTCKRWEPRAIDAFFGTSLTGRRIEHRRVAAWWRPVLDAAPIPLQLLRSALLQRQARRLEPGADLVVSADNEWSLDGTGVHYVHYPSRARPRPDADMRWYHRRGPLALYYAVSDRLAAFDTADVRRQVLLANSDWTADVIRRLHGADARTVYPPIAGTFVERSWEAREDVVLSIGRFSPEKRFECVIAIIEALRNRGHALALTIVGDEGGGAYGRRIRALVARRPWITIRSGLTRPVLLDLMSRCRYGLHAMVDEHFGMATAELMEAGCLTFVHRSGGQMEIVRSDDLSYVDVDDAVMRIERAIVDAEHRERLLAHLAALRGRFSPAAFCARVREVVDETLTAGSRPPASAASRP